MSVDKRPDQPEQQRRRLFQENKLLRSQRDEFIKTIEAITITWEAKAKPLSEYCSLLDQLRSAIIDARNAKP